ncbi:MAG: VOC family protein [Pseudomonadales bacterium]|nr:VOC family protein [Pseudomonadales bacterium]
MSRIFGPIAQSGYVVPDLDKAIEHWANTLGVGPWFELDTSVFEEMLYRSQPTDMRVRIALANSGDLQIELIQPLDDEPSPYRDFLQDNGGHGGLQHVSSWPSTDTFDNLIANHQVTFSGRGGGTRFAYFSDALDFGMMMEIADLTRGTRAYFDEIKAAAAHWNGVSARA